MPFPTRGLYAITQPEGKDPAAVVAEVEAALRGGAAVIQYRDKAPHDALRLARALLALCRTYTVPLLINDSIDLAASIGADGVHLGQNDGALAEARQQLGATAIIGVSCYNSVERAEQLAALGADYVAFGRFFPSSSKPLAAPAELESLRLAKQRLRVPIVAIGGITPDNGAALLAAGADVLAVIGGVFSHNPEASARRFQPLFAD